MSQRTRDPLFDPPDVTFQPVSPRLTRLRRITALISFAVPILAALIVAIAVPWPWAYAIAGALVLCLAWVWLLIPRQVRAIGYAERSDDLLIRSGVLFRTLVVVPYGRMQYVDVNVGPFERALSLSSLQLHTASASTDASLSGLEMDEAARLRDRLASRGEARLAGL